MGKRGPEPKKIDWEQFDKLVSYQCTQPELAAFFDCDIKTIDAALQRERGVKLSEIWEQREFLGRVKLRKIQFDHAKRHWQMSIYLGKVILGQCETRPTPLDLNSPSGLVLDAKVATDPIVKTFQEFCAQASYFDPFDTQHEMRAFAIDETETRLLLGARGYGKTDYCTIMGVAYDLYLAVEYKLNLDECTNLIITKSKSRNTAIVNEIANALLKNGVALEKSNSSIIRIQGLVGQDHSVEAITIKTSMRGRHPKRIIMDDPVTDEDVSEAMRRIVKTKYDEAYKLSKNICIIGQPAHFDDLYANLRGVVKTLEVPHGTIPQLDADLEAMKLAGVDQSSIEMSYHLRVPTEGNFPFDKIKYLDAYPIGDSVAFIDPSFEGGDYTALSIVRGYGQGVAVVGFVFKKAWNHAIDDIGPKLRQFGVKRLCFETNSLGDQPIELLRSVLSDIGIVGKKSNGNKHSRIMAAGSFAHLIHLSKESDKNYTDQVVKYEYRAKFDDAPDSLASVLEWIGLIRGKR